ncbi:hypothetical protein C3L23_08560 [Nautilia sp. PV-1]|uniref:glycosyltransferase n=1 Tax=Nautilia sp. PV-1 TaxID=2579250 RepID=UPI000FDB8F66|nr:glycosyltransferase [Nautilia sp. PV-1]AZV47321.1 hypothetical protein C3L23_08560 [Nautilia sp. PV-1]
MDDKLVSVIIVTHNRSQLLKKAINSVIKQTYKNIELIVVDDCSDDNTYEVVKSFDYPIIYYRLSVQSGANVARNKGIDLANGYYITGLDDDDEMLPDRVKRLVESYNDKYAYVFSQVYFDDGYKKLKKDFAKFKNILTLNDMLYVNFTGNQVLTTKENLIKAGKYDEKLPSAQDYDMWIRLLQIKPYAQKVKRPLMIINKNNNMQRISSSKLKIKGYFLFYKKYKHLMNIDQKKFQLFKLFLIKGKKINLKKFFLFLPKKNINIVILYIYINLKYFLKNILKPNSSKIK